MLDLLHVIAPGLTDRPGAGPVSAAQTVVSFSPPRQSAQRRRALNRAVRTIALTRMRSCSRTRSYVARRTAEGKTTREIRRRILQRYITRELYRALSHPPEIDNT